MSGICTVTQQVHEHWHVLLTTNIDTVTRAQQMKSTHADGVFDVDLHAQTHCS